MPVTKNNKHLTAEQVAICAEALNNNSYFKLHKELRQHIHICDKCAAEVINVAELISDREEINIPDSFDEDIEEEKFKKLKPLNKKLIISIASAAAIILAVITLTPLWFSPGDKNKIAVVQNDVYNKTDKSAAANSILKEKPEKEHKIITDTTSEITDSETIDAPKLANFEPDPVLEQLYDNLQGTYRGRTVEVKTPPEIKYCDKLKLKWTNPEKETLHLELFNNKGEEIYTSTSTKESVTLPPLQPGLYYWKLINSNFELLFVGKIINR
ncbi:hypothetical protein QA597_04490 [Marinilabiliaceae bacterium ANBcel2]|nr:hypothetical protein [Marinilabiliaceae bacterium ANBcel2]